jgi:CRP-like cAMP-binding protein
VLSGADLMVIASTNGRVTACEACPLRAKQALRDFSAEELQFVKAFKADEIEVAAGTSFLQEGTRNEHLFTVLQGWAFRYKMLDDGRRQILNYALPADLVGLQGSLMGEMEHSVEALTDVVLCVFPRRKLWDLYAQFPSLGFDLTWLAAREEHFIDENLVSLGRRTALERTAYLLLHLFQRADEVGLTRGQTLVFPFTQQHVADTLGMSLVHTNKTLKRLMATKAARWKDRSFELLDRDAMTRIAGIAVRRDVRRPFL